MSSATRLVPASVTRQSATEALTLADIEPADDLTVVKIQLWPIMVVYERVGGREQAGWMSRE